MKKTLLLFLFAFSCAAGAFAQKTPLVATVDIQRIMNDYKAFQVAVGQLEGSIAPVNEEIKKLQESRQGIMIKGRELEAEIDNPSLTDERKAEAQTEVEELRQQLQRVQLEMQQFHQQAKQLAQQGQQDQLAPLRQKAIEAIKQVAEDKGIDVVLPLDVVLFSSDELEISDAVIAVLNASE